MTNLVDKSQENGVLYMQKWKRDKQLKMIFFIGLLFIIGFHSTTQIMTSTTSTVVAASSNYLIVTVSDTPDIIYTKNTTWELTLYNQEDISLILHSLEITFTRGSTEVETVFHPINETLYGKSEITKNFTISAINTPPSTYEVTFTVNCKPYEGSTRSETLLTEQVSVLAIDLISKIVSLADTPNTAKQVSVYIINLWERHLDVSNCYFKFTSESGSNTYENSSLKQFILYGKKWINTTIVTPTKDENYTISLMFEYQTDFLYKSVTGRSTLTQEIVFASILVQSASESFNLPHNVVYGLIFGIIGCLLAVMILKFKPIPKTCSICKTSQMDAPTERFYKCCGTVYCGVCALERLHRKCPQCGKLLK